MPGQMDGQSGSSISISKGSTFTIRSSDGTAVYTDEAVYDARFVFFSSAAMTSGETYTLTSGGTELATATAGGTGTAAVTTPGTSADTADTPRPPTATPACISHWVSWRCWVQPPPWSWWSCGSRKKPDLFPLL